MKSAIDLPLHDPTAWPYLMTRPEVAHVCRLSLRSLQRLIVSGRFPQPVHRTWDRDVVTLWTKKRKELDKAATKFEKQAAPRVLQIAGAAR